ncbi:RidA family protein [Pseudaminobacter arsenicus]|uniref:RidA family protein n=1 Tax=Borborobacter arsenicus TaxID=1851146 RepID=A0A432V0U5_9HYPH|nr:RidA family protein [Pseudaminobacter arsenicus]RUM95799.1 RidA family protein [Pseudaminobacter arsenicus]
MTPSSRFKALGLVLPPPPAPIANYVPYVIDGDLLYLSGQGQREADGSLRTGKVGRDVGIDRAYDDARLTGLNLLAVIQSALSDLDRVRRIVKLLGMVNAVPDFAYHPKVINGCSDLLIDVFGDNGRHARSAVGFGSLPGNITVEIEAIVAIRT